jgi:hypothetical protein
MSQLILRPLLLAAMALAAPALAQRQAPVRDDEEIVVTGTRNAEEQVRDFVGALTKTPPFGQLGKFERDVCPAVFGVAEAQKQAVLQRMKRVAVAAGIPVASGRCEPNAILVVTDDKEAFIEALLRERPAYFSGVGRSQARRLAKTPGPAAAWQLEGMLTADGKEMPTELPPNEIFVDDKVGAPSRIVASARPYFMGAVVVLEKKGLVGLRATQVADYAAMRAFAQVEPSRLAGSPSPTILKILDAPLGTPVPVTLTSWDLAFLKALYASQENRHSAAQRTEIRRRVKEELASPPKIRD